MVNWTFVQSVRLFKSLNYRRHQFAFVFLRPWSSLTAEFIGWATDDEAQLDFLLEKLCSSAAWMKQTRHYESFCRLSNTSEKSDVKNTTQDTSAWLDYIQAFVVMKFDFFPV